MTIGFATRSRLTILVLGAAALGTTGCELIPGLLSGPGPGTPDPASTSAPLIVTVERVEGAIEGHPLDPSVVAVNGVRSGLALQFDVSIPAQRWSVNISTAGSESSSENPYVGGPGDFGEPFPADGGPIFRRDAGPLPPGADASPPPPPSFEPTFDPSQARVTACSANGRCRDADDFGLEIVQLAEGRSMTLDGTWIGGDRIHLEMHYREQR